MTGISSYNSQLTPVYLLHTEKRGKPVWLFVFNMAFPTSLFMTSREIKGQHNSIGQENIPCNDKTKMLKPGTNSGKAAGVVLINLP